MDTDKKMTIIAATNFSAIANNAVTYAAGITKAIGGQLLLFNSFSMPVHTANSRISADALQKQIDKASERLATLANEISNIYSIKVFSYCNYSFLEDQLPSLIEGTGAELLVMGMAQRSLEQDVLGNSTTSAIKNCDIPILAVPFNARFQNTKKILFAFDKFRELSVKKLVWLREAVKLIGGEIELFSVDEKIVEMKLSNSPALLGNIIEDELKDMKYFYKTVRSNSVIGEIKKEIKNYGADVLVMVPQKHGFWDSLIHKSKTRMMASGMDIPLLSLPNY